MSPSAVTRQRLRTSRSRTSGVLVLVLVLAAGCGTAPSVTPTPGPAMSPSPSVADATPVRTLSLAGSVDPALAGRLSAELDSALADSGAPGAQAAVAFEDGSVWTAGTGMSTPDRPMTPDLLNPLASVTKVYTATLVIGLAEAGVLSLDDPLVRWLPDAPQAGGVTIRQLLDHTSGRASDDASLPPVCAPGTCYSYSNSGYNDLGRVVEAATGQDYAQVLHERILQPLGLGLDLLPAPGSRGRGVGDGSRPR